MSQLARLWWYTIAGISNGLDQPGSGSKLDNEVTVPGPSWFAVGAFSKTGLLHKMVLLGQMTNDTRA